jgi:hypothetical protein
LFFKYSPTVANGNHEDFHRDNNNLNNNHADKDHDDEAEVRLSTYEVVDHFILSPTFVIATNFDALVTRV